MKVRDIIKRYSDYAEKIQQAISNELDIDEGVAVFQDYVEFMNMDVKYHKTKCKHLYASWCHNPRQEHQELCAFYIADESQKNCAWYEESKEEIKNERKKGCKK